MGRSKSSRRGVIAAWRHRGVASPLAGVFGMTNECQYVYNCSLTYTY